jgi:hypothetical protein
MAIEKSHTGLGIFIFVTLVVVLATAALFIQRLRSRDVIAIVTYTNENVSGLEISSPVRYKGVPVGRVTDVRVNPEGGALIEIDFELFLDRLNTINPNIPPVRGVADIRIFPKLRARTVANPVTGEEYLLLDVPKDPPPPIELGFTPTRPYVPSMPSVMGSLREQLPALVERAEATLQVLREIIKRVPDSLDRSDRFFTNVERIVGQSDLPALSADSRKFYSNSTTQFEQMRSDQQKFFSTATAELERMRSELGAAMGADGSLVKFSEEARAAIKEADFPAVNQSARDAAENSKLAAEDLRRSLPAIRHSLEQIRELARMIEEQPESVVYGPRQPKAKRP